MRRGGDMKKLIGAIGACLLVVLAIQYGRVASLNRGPGNAYPRIVSLAPNLTEIAFELGAGAQIVGVTNYCVYPPEALKKERVGDFVSPNLEKIVYLKPDLVLAERWTSSKVVPHLREMKLSVIEVETPKSVGEIYGVIREVGAAVGKPDRAGELIRNMQQRVRSIEEQGKRFPRRPSLYVEIDLPSWTVGRNSFITEAIFLSGARNTFEDIERPALQVSREMVIARDPEFIVSFEAGIPEIQQRPGWNQIRAVREGKIIKTAERNLLTHGNHRLVEGMETLQAALEKLLGAGRSEAGKPPQASPPATVRSPG